MRSFLYCLVSIDAFLACLYRMSLVSVDLCAVAGFVRRMSFFRRLFGLLLLGVLTPIVLAIFGCTTPNRVDKSPLSQPVMSADSVVLEIFFARFPVEDEHASCQLWEEVDEQHFPANVRRRLVGNGFRVGLIGCQIPINLSNLLELSDKSPPIDQTVETDVGLLEADPNVTRRHIQLRAGQRSEIITSGVYDELPVLVNEAGRLSGCTYEKTQTLLAIKSFPQSDGSVKLELVPELHYGDPRQSWTGGQGVLRLRTGRDRQVFTEMGVNAVLSPGQMILMTSLSNRPGSLGHYFFTETAAGQLERKLIVVRLSQTQHDGLFEPPIPLSLD